jgi:hypothetical protein
MVCLSQNQLESKYTSLANGNIAWGNYYSPPSYTWVYSQFGKLEIYRVDE